MGIVKGGALRLFQTFLYALAFCCSAVILGIYSYFLSVLADRDIAIPTWEKAVEGLSGAAVLYLIFAVILTCCLGGIQVFAFLALVLDICFVGAMIAIAVMTRHGASSCSGIVNTPLGTGEANSHAAGFNGDFGFGDNDTLTYAVSLHTACRLNTAAFAVSIIAAILFLITAGMQVLLVRHHKKEKRYGPSPSNNYTSGFGKRKFWQRKPKGNARDTELGAGGLAAHGPDMRPSHETGTTIGNNNAAAYDKDAYAPQQGSHGTYYGAPQGTANPYTMTTGTATNY
ncbi:hypothetical protein M409DRAFT_58846 [Zasmidium cellare ATCC 36951]|uniref:MARVEL domain-containing protein n=1 Tax=Zasmidium cellare ATCC 36951 TaxID=1080233 RepID=A0A6A6C6D5_ZASCE|nr:uncharacterized protein M409DRAFT_58846 [Zasmidium cellare ATCC 36951]KAF2161770.1 hypothetical protein M409DRAFT_58846 [Zasmidium cellare ATCC 36951]